MLERTPAEGTAQLAQAVGSALTANDPRADVWGADHYREEARSQGTLGTSTMRDEITRSREVDAALRLLAHVQGDDVPLRLLDVGCGNGYLLAAIAEQFANITLSGLDTLPEMLELARGRRVAGCEVVAGDARQMPFPDAAFDVVVSERCIINLRTRADQAKALSEIARVLRIGGHYICIEAFTDGLAELNEAREQLGLAANAQPDHNLWLDKQWFFRAVEAWAEVRDPASLGDESLPASNFLSSHYFISRVVYPALTRREVLYNTHFVKFFAFLPPMGNYAPIQLFVLRKRADGH